MSKIKVFYTNARLNGKTCLLAGPFMSSAEAENMLDVVGPMFTRDEPKAEFASFGVMSVTGHAGFGIYNKVLKANGINVPVPDN